MDKHAVVKDLLNDSKENSIKSMETEDTDLSCCHRTKQVLVTVYTEFTQNPNFLVAVLNCALANCCEIGCILFSTLLATDVFQAQGKTNQEAEEYLSYLFLAANLLCLFLSLAVGIMADKLKIYKMLLTLNVFVLLSASLMLYEMYANDFKTLGILFDVGFVVAVGM